MIMLVDKKMKWIYIRTIETVESSLRSEYVCGKQYDCEFDYCIADELNNSHWSSSLIFGVVRSKCCFLLMMSFMWK